MNKHFLVATVSVAMLSTTVSADALKNSLTNIMGTDTSTPMVDLSRINLNGKPKPKPQLRKDRPGSTVIATVNGHKILKKTADRYIKKATKGKIKSYDHIPPKQQKRLLQDLVMPIVAYDTAKKELTQEEKDMVITRTWMRKEAGKIQIKDEEVRGIYDGIKQQALDNNASKPIPPFESIKNRLKSQMIEKRIVGKLMKDVKIEVAP